MTQNNRIKLLREKMGISARDLSLRTGIPYDSLKNYEYGRRKPAGEALAKLEKFFNVSGAYLLGSTDALLGNNESEYIWEDSDVMSSLKDGIPSIMNKLMENISGSNSEDQKLFFDLLVELRLLTSPKDKNRTHILSTLQELLFIYIRYINTCKNFTDDLDNVLIDKVTAEAIEEFKSLLKECSDLFVT